MELSFLLLFAWLLRWSSAFDQNQKFVYMAGRHICASEVDEPKMVAVQSTICIPVLQSYRKKCRDANGEILNVYCTGYRTVYQQVTKTKYKMVPGRRVKYECCPGWRRQSGKAGCTEPICEAGCFNDGTCIGPNKCKCLPGYSGSDCREDVNECELHNGGCDHSCQNTNGSFLCTCREGFKLASDKRSCNFCLTCTKEWEDMQLRILAMEKAIVSLAVKLKSWESKDLQYEEEEQDKVAIPDSDEPENNLHKS